MELSIVINADKDSSKTDDTVESALYYMTNQVLLVIDESFAYQSENAYSIKGFRNFPHKNAMLGLLTLVKKWPNSDWYCYMNSNSLVGSNFFKKDLKTAEKQGVWCMGNNLQTEQDVYLPLVEMILKTELNEASHFMGAFLFLHKRYIQKAMEVGFFERFLYMTNDFPCEYNILNYLFPTACRYWGGTVTQFAKWNDSLDMWIGNFRKYPMRQYTELSRKEEYSQASLMHPVTKSIREFHKLKRGSYAERRI